MLKIVMKIDGMACGMCEAHVNDALRRVDGVKKTSRGDCRGRGGYGPAARGGGGNGLQSIVHQRRAV